MELMFSCRLWNGNLCQDLEENMYFSIFSSDEYQQISYTYVTLETTNFFLPEANFYQKFNTHLEVNFEFEGFKDFPSETKMGHCEQKISEH